MVMGVTGLGAPGTDLLIGTAWSSTGAVRRRREGVQASAPAWIGRYGPSVDFEHGYQLIHVEVVDESTSADGLRKRGTEQTVARLHDGVGSLT
jgi:hypothetical protein